MIDFSSCEDTVWLLPYSKEEQLRLMKPSLSFVQSAFALFATIALWLAPALHAQPVGDALPIVGIKTVRAETMEPSPLTRIAPGEFVVYRSGSTSGELLVYLAIEGSATPGVDYAALEKFVRFPAGAAQVS